MSRCSLAQQQPWEPRGGAQSSTWPTREQSSLNWQKPCQRPSYYYTEAAPKAWSYYLPHKDPLQQENAYYRYPFRGSNQIYRQLGNFYSEPKGACVTKYGCIDGSTSSGCLYMPFYAGAKCAQVAEMGQPTTGVRDFSMTTQPTPSEFKPWQQMQDTYDDLLENWRYNRPGYND